MHHNTTMIEHSEFGLIGRIALFSLASLVGIVSFVM
ncbi:hypothetical protein VINE108521_04380 [Vibrio neonatus]